MKNILIPKVFKIKLIKREAVVKAVTVGVSFIISPIIGVLMFIWEALNLKRLNSLRWVDDIRRGSVIEEIIWVIIAVVAGSFLPMPIAICLLAWRAIMLFKALTKR